MNKVKFLGIFILVAFCLILFHTIVFAVGMLFWLFKIIFISGIIAFIVYGVLSVKEKLK